MSRFLAHHFAISYPALCAAAAWACWSADAAGAFIYFGYIPAYAVAVGLVALGLVLFGREPRIKSDAILLAVTTTVLFGFLLALPRVATSDRKAFSLVAASLTNGMSVTEVNTRMRVVASHPGFRAAVHSGALCFYLYSAPGTQDVIIVQPSSDGQRVVDVQYSVD
jgi:hypothetical protein